MGRPANGDPVAIQSIAEPSWSSASEPQKRLLDLEVERGSVQAKAAIAESGVMALHYAAEPLGIGTDGETAIRLLIALLVLCCDPPRASCAKLGAETYKFIIDVKWLFDLP